MFANNFNNLEKIEYLKLILNKNKLLAIPGLNKNK